MVVSLSFQSMSKRRKLVRPGNVFMEDPNLVSPSRNLKRKESRNLVITCEEWSATGGIPDEIWEDNIISKIINDDDDSQLKSLSLVSKRFLAITNRLKHTLKITPTSLLPRDDDDRKNRLKIKYLCSRFPNITTFFLSFSSHHQPFQTIAELPQFQLPIQTLILSQFSRFPGKEFTHCWPASARARIRSLILSSMNFVTDTDLRDIGDLFPNLEELDVGKAPGFLLCDPVTDQGIALLASKLHRHLRIINLDTNGWLSDKAIISLCENCVNLEKVVVTRCPGVTSGGISFALRKCKNLKLIA